MIAMVRLSIVLSVITQRCPEVASVAATVRSEIASYAIIFHHIMVPVVVGFPCAMG